MRSRKQKILRATAKTGWLVLLIAIGAILVALEVSGIQTVFGLWIALGLVIAAETIFGLTMKVGRKKNDLRLKLFARGLMIALSIMFGMSLAQHTKHSGSERKNQVTADSELITAREQLTMAKADVTALESQINQVSEEIGIHRGALTSKATLSQTEIDRARDGIATLQAAQNRMLAEEQTGRGRNWYNAKMDFETAQQTYGTIAVLQSRLDNNAAAVNDINLVTQGMTGKQSRLQALQERLAAAQTVVAGLNSQLGTKAVKSAVVDDQAYFVVSGSKRIANQDADIADAILVLLFAALGFLLQGGFGRLCCVELFAAEPDEAETVPPVNLDPPKRRFKPIKGTTKALEAARRVPVTGPAPVGTPDHGGMNYSSETPGGNLGGDIDDETAMVNPVAAALNGQHKQDKPDANVAGFPGVDVARMDSTTAKWWIRTLNRARVLEKPLTDKEIVSMPLVEKKEVIRKTVNGRVQALASLCL